MTLTFGRAPFTHPPGGTYNFDLWGVAPESILYLEPVPKRIRGVLAGTTIVDTREATMLHETGKMIQWYLPLRDVVADVLQTSSHRTPNRIRGEATHYHVRVGDRVEQNAAWSHLTPPREMAQLSQLVAFHFDRIDAWFEEDDQVTGHPRDPYHRFDCRRTSDSVEVRVGTETIAATRRAIKLFETSTVTRYYIPRDDVKAGALTPTQKRTYCPYKGEASYFDVHGDGITVHDGAWTLPKPIGEADVVLGYVSFWRETQVLANGRLVEV